MSKKKYSKRAKVNSSQSTYTNALQAAQITPNRFFPFYPISRAATTPTDRARIISRARYLDSSMSQVRMAVQTMISLTGTLSARPATKDEEWNELAREVFNKRALNPNLFDITGRYNFRTAQQYIEHRAIVDGDSLTVLCSTLDGGKIALYPSTQLVSTLETDGVELNKYGKISGYRLNDTLNKKEVYISASKAILYRHTSTDIMTQRGQSDLLAAILTAQDLLEIASYQKDAIKLAAAFSLIETVEPQAASISDLKQMRNGGTAGNASNAPLPLILGGVQATTLSAGHKLELLTDKRPSNETRAFINDLVNSIAYSVGLDASLLYHPENMGSASVRFTIAKAKDWAEARLEDRKIWCNRVYQHIISNEIAAGRLRPCKDLDNPYAVKWVNKSHWSIDLGRDAASAIKLVDAGLLDADDYTLATCGKTVEEIAKNKLHTLTHIKEAYEKHGLTLQDYNKAYETTGNTTVAPLPVDDEPEATEATEETDKD